MKEKLVGKTKEEAIKLLKESNSKFRITREDNERYMVTMDYQPFRFNIGLDSDVVTEVTMG